MGEVVRYPANRPLKLRGIGRDATDERSVSLFFNRRLTDDELRFFHECSERTAALMPDSFHD